MYQKLYEYIRSWKVIDKNPYDDVPYMQVADNLFMKMQTTHAFHRGSLPYQRQKARSGKRFLNYTTQAGMEEVLSTERWEQPNKFILQ